MYYGSLASRRETFASLVNNAIALAGDNACALNLDEDSDGWLNVDKDALDKKLSSTMLPGNDNGMEDGTYMGAEDEDETKGRLRPAARASESVHCPGCRIQLVWLDAVMREGGQGSDAFTNKKHGR